MRTLPNLELLEYQVKLIINNDINIREKIKSFYESKGFSTKNIVGDITCEVFMQTWGSTATAFGGMGGQMMTDAYTTVFHEQISDTYIVFIDNQLCYQVDNPNETFLKDLEKRHLKSLREAHEYY